MPGDLKEEIKKFLQFAEERVIKHQAFKLFDLDGDGVVTVTECFDMTSLGLAFHHCTNLQ